MPYKSELSNRIPYFLPKRVALAFAVIEVIAVEKNPTATRIMEITGHSRAYVSSCLTGLRKQGIIQSTIGGTGGYSLVDGVDQTTVGNVLEAISKDEDRSPLIITLHRLLIGKAQSLTIEELLNGSKKT